MSLVRQKIKDRFDRLEEAMNQQKHLKTSELPEVLNLIDSVSKYWSVLDDEHRDFLNAVRFAVEDKLEWK